jgi:hypothetical protein
MLVRLRFNGILKTPIMDSYPAAKAARVAFPLRTKVEDGASSRSEETCEPVFVQELLMLLLQSIRDEID